MKVENLSTAVLELVKNYRWDNGVEKHEMSSWEYLLTPPEVEFINVDGFDVLLPVEKSHHPKITLLRCIVSADKRTLTIFLKDTFHAAGLTTGFLAVCVKVPEQEWYIAILYHDCYIAPQMKKILDLAL